MKKIGLIAGGGQFPIIFSKKAKAKGYGVYAIAYMNEADPELENYVDTIKWAHLGQIKQLLKFFKAHDITETVLMGTIKKPSLFKGFKPDTKAITLLAGMRSTHDDAILKAFSDLLEKEGIRVRASTFLLPEILAQKGCWTKRKPSRSEKADIDFGWDLAKEIGRLDIGQCVVVGGGSVLAVEAIDGTDATIKRGGALGSGTAVVVKVSKPEQDLRFDMPAVGVDTIQTMDNAGAKVLAVEAGKAVVFEKEEMVALADKCGISIVALDKGIQN
ncbi:MAG: LpxI family protein [Desulfobacterales bacterium]|nr:LpxI family protein [Desulfobacterales bacterium]